ncbi:MAG: AAA family ATPase, partial [Planctomycetota bacterium]
MLKALELSGFKSFADKTRFEFPPGITVVVGPNGSGKSNIVDAIKWVLGEQSAKSLRGKEMADVIFKGSSGANSRRPANAATATIVLDNADNRFAFDADEVHVSRRVYRSGESEYLINGETSRLKDIRELFRGTGVGTDAYSLIEQGKVERMLSSSPKDRRTIFEEAAGISRFKAKKIDAQRRLARVEGNLVRLADIVEEVGSRYRSIKSQATKAARYKELSDRLQQLRTYVGFKDWRTFTEKLQNFEDDNRESEANVVRLRNLIAAQDDQFKTVESDLDAISEKLVEKQEVASAIRERIARVESEFQLNTERIADIQHREARLEEQLKRADERTREFENRIETVRSEADASQESHDKATANLESITSELTELDEAVLRLQKDAQDQRNKRAELAEMVARIVRTVTTSEASQASLEENKNRLDQVVQTKRGQLKKVEFEFREYSGAREQLQKDAESNDSALKEAKAGLKRIREELAGRRERYSDLNTKKAGLSQRAEVIEELERSLEGINAGAKELLKLSKSENAGPTAEVIGLVADLVAVTVQHAGLVDVALGEYAQFVVVNGDRLINEVADEKIKLGGRVGLIQLESPPTLETDVSVDLNGAPGVIGRADRLVQVAKAYAPFIKQLLGGTWVVKTLGDGLHLHQNREGGDRVRFVSLDGEIVESNGTVIVGPKSIATGLVS